MALTNQTFLGFLSARSEVVWTTIGDIDAEYFYDPAGNRTTSVWGLRR